MKYTFESFVAYKFISLSFNKSQKIISLLRFTMNTQDRARILSQFVSRLDEAKTTKESDRLTDEINEQQLNEDNLPQLDIVDELMEYHRDITGTIENTYREVKDVMIQMKELKNRKKNVQVIMDSMTAIVQIKRLSYGLGADPKEISTNIQSYYAIKGKVYHMDKFIERIQKQIKDIQKEYQIIFDAEIAKNNSSNITQISKVLQLIRNNASQSNKPNTLQQITNFCVNCAKKEFKEIQQALFAIPIVGNNESNYLFFDMSKTAMKVIATLSNNCKNNVLKVSGEEGLIHILKTLFQLVTSGIIFELLMRLKKYYEIDKITINKQKKFVLQQDEVKKLQPYIKEYTAIWNQLQRLRIHLLAQVNGSNSNKIDLKMALQNTLNNSQLVQFNTNIITFMQAFMRYRFEKLLKHSKFVIALCNIETDFFKEINKSNLAHNNHVQDFLQQTINRISQGLEKGLQTLNMLVISALINFTNHNLIYEDVFQAFNKLFRLSFNKFPSKDPKHHTALLLTLNAIAAFPKAMKILLHIKLPQQVSEQRIKVQIEQVINNNQRRTWSILQGLINKIVAAQWFRVQLGKDYQKNIQKWLGLEPDCFHRFVQGTCKTHAQLILETQFSKKYTQVSAINFEKEVRAIKTFYQGYSHDILPNFKRILDYLQVLQLEGEEDFKDIVRRFSNLYGQAELKSIWALRN